MADELKDWAPKWWIKKVLERLPVPLNPETGKPAWSEPPHADLHGAQWELISSPARYKQAGGGVRYGKSFILAMTIFVDLCWRRLNGRMDDLWWIVGPDYEQTKEEMRHLHRLLDVAGILHDWHHPDGSQSWTITFPDMEAEISTKSSKEEMKIAGRPPRGIGMSEAAQQTNEAFTSCKLRLLESFGWLMMSGTFEDALPWYYQVADEWAKPDAEGLFFECPSWDNKVVFPGGRDDPKILAYERDLPPAVFMEKIGGKPQKASSLKMPQANERFHIAHRYPGLKTSYDPEEAVILFADPGTAHAYAVVAVQLFGNIAWAIDIVYRWGRTTQEIIAECAAKEWSRNVETLVMDFAGTQRRSEGPPNTEQWRYGWFDLLKQELYVVTQPVPLHVGYDLHQRALLNSWPEDEAQKMFNPEREQRRVTDPEGHRLMFDPKAAQPLFGGYVDGRSYRGEYNNHRNKRGRDNQPTPGDDPIDADNDAIKAVNYGLVWLFSASGRARNRLIGQAGDWELRAG